jgi:hypothetical protein
VTGVQKCKELPHFDRRDNMRQRVNKNIAKVNPERNLQNNVQMRQKAKESEALRHNYNPLENIVCKIGDNACATKHLSVIQRTGLFHPMNGSQRAQSLFRLQQQYGNRFVQRVIAQHVQTKMTVSQPGDIYEREADRVANQVMQMPKPQLQRQTEEEEEKDLLQTKPIAEQITPLAQRQIEEEEEEELQAKEISSQASEVTTGLESGINALRSSGRQIPESERAFFENRFKSDFSQVRIHTDNNAAQISQSLNAQAFTVGRDIVFGAGQYAPESNVGRRLIAHELTHVIQQNVSIPRSKVKIQRRSIIFGAGEVRFNDCSEQDLSDFAVIPEEGTTTFTPSNGVWHETDGFWWRHHSPKTEWFKISDDCEVDVTCTETGFSWSEDCTFTTPGWTSDPHGSTNPF